MKPEIAESKQPCRRSRASLAVTGVRSGGCGPVNVKGPGLISGETRPLDRLRPCRSAPAGASRPPPALAGAIFMRTVGSGQAGRRRPDRPRPPPRPPRPAPAPCPPPRPRPAPAAQPPGIQVGSRELYVYGQVRQNVPCLPHNSIGGERFRLRWLNQGKRAEGCGCDLVNPVTANL